MYMNMYTCICILKSTKYASFIFYAFKQFIWQIYYPQNNIL